ncbi:MAG: nucleotidyl transferase AbiEii/AbiGii toxin family protein [Planctomycetaceae bacterium]|nr:nucleotidyl transferase AbiEii/AbiGii toxin family protein [Planctomycetaceae bacterium]
MSPRNVAASVRQRLMNVSRTTKEPFDLVLTRFALERLLFRLTQSAHADRFVLKGAMLFQIWTGDVHRPTRDLDLLGSGEPEPEAFAQIFQNVCDVPVPDDGLVFDSQSVQAARMKADEQYEGLRLKLTAHMASARIPVQIDIGFGDAITPGPERTQYPAILDFPAPSLTVYPRETVIAEKLQAMVHLGIANSRMKDFYDIRSLARQFSFSGTRLAEAIAATFVRRQTELPTEAPLALTSAFATDKQKQTQWKAFLRKTRLDASLDLTHITADLAEFLLPPLSAAGRQERFPQHWSFADKWKAAASDLAAESPPDGR